ncbi:B3 domain-containing protein At1g05920-like [Eucalyptus grandis]|uniref:B3 domain-containing protein At1g05920-like n=1 Tax=Eucalyptus grandis TaxID=71139 RepID=UPI00192EBA77|nr:B3 domain-containing protein At1g05920-like [Eucalyptus grandis]
MHGQGVMLVLEKRLCATDLKRCNGWLSIPRGQIRANFLTSGEIQALDNKEAIAVSLIEPCLQVRHGLQLQKWNNVRNHFSYVLTKEWTAVAHPIARNGLKKGGLVQLWSFRANGDLCFCLVNVEAPPSAEENMATCE